LFDGSIENLLCKAYELETELTLGPLVAQNVSAGQVRDVVYANLVAVVDDDPGMLRAINRLLRQHDYEPILFSSAQAFKSHTDFEKAACVILDIDLNDGSGIELRHGLKAAGVSVPVIYITGNETPAVREAALISGCVAFLTKTILSEGTDRAAQECIGGAFIVRPPQLPAS
jgi:DNA-binding NtrC family response regulator